MKKQAITKEERMLKNIQILYSPALKNKIVERLENSIHSKKMIEVWFFIRETIFTECFNECFNELLEENLIIEIGDFFCPISKINTKFYGTEKLISNLNNIQNGK